MAKNRERGPSSGSGARSDSAKKVAAEPAGKAEAHDANPKRITIDPITRLEGHGRIEIFLNDEGGVDSAYLQIPELRGFEKFCEGRPVEELPRIVPRICGV
jgi:hypothetical protein